MGFDFSRAVDRIACRPVDESIWAVVSPELAFVPERQFHCQRGKECRLAAAKSQPCAHSKRAAIIGQFKISSRIVVAVVKRVMRDAAKNAIQRDLLVGIEQMVNTDREFTAMAG